MWSEADSFCSGQPIHLWQFLRELLLKPHNYGRCIRWLNKEKGESPWSSGAPYSRQAILTVLTFTSSPVVCKLPIAGLKVSLLSSIIITFIIINTTTTTSTTTIITTTTTTTTNKNNNNNYYYYSLRHLQNRRLGPRGKTLGHQEKPPGHELRQAEPLYPPVLQEGNHQEA